MEAPQGEETVTYWGRHVVSDTTIGGERYVNVRSCALDADGALACQEARPLRYDGAAAAVVEHTDEGDVWGGALPCRLDHPFGAVGGRYPPSGAATVVR